MKDNINPCWVMSKENEEIFKSDFKVEITGDEFNTYQRAAYIEDGFYIQVSTWWFKLFEIPQYGGVAIELCSKNTINEIIDFYKDANR